MLQTSGGTKELEKSIPSLNFREKRLKEEKDRQKMEGTYKKH